MTNSTPAESLTPEQLKSVEETVDRRNRLAEFMLFRKMEELEKLREALKEKTRINKNSKELARKKSKVAKLSRKLNRRK